MIRTMGLTEDEKLIFDFPLDEISKRSFLWYWVDFDQPNKYDDFDNYLVHLYLTRFHCRRVWDEFRSYAGITLEVRICDCYRCHVDYVSSYGDAV